MRLGVLLPCLIGVLLLVARPAQADLPEVVKRYVDDLTLIVGRFDITELSADAIVSFVGDLMREAPADERERVTTRLREGLAEFDEMFAPFRERGVTTTWFVVGPDTFIADEPALMIVPVTDDEQAKLVTDFLMKEGQDYRRVDGAVLVARRGKLNMAEGTQPVDRPGLSRGIAVGRAAPALQLVFEPTPMVRLAAEMGARQLLAQAPMFPPELPELVAALDTMSLQAALPPRARGSLSVDFTDEPSAELAEKVLGEQVKQFERPLSRVDLEPERVQAFLGALAPEAQQKRVTIELTNEELREIVGPIMVMTMLQGREGANRVRAGRNLRKLAQTIILWSYEIGDGRLPPDLASIEEVFGDPRTEGMTWRMANRNPRFAADNAFAYVRPAERLDEIKEPDVTVIAYEKPPAGGIREGLNVAFADGRVEWLEAALFEELAAKQGFEIERLPR